MLLGVLDEQLVPELEKNKREGISSPDLNNGEVLVPHDGAVGQIIEQEHRYKRELWRLQKILRRGMASEDPLPVFNRRHILILVKRLCKDLENSTSRLRKDMDIARLSDALQNATLVSHGLLCIAYADNLTEIRDFLKRETSRVGDSNIAICQELHAERALLPLHRLNYLKSLSCLPHQHNDVISSALDGCYVAISSIHSQGFVAEIDRLLDFALSMDPPPSQYYSSISNTHIYQELSYSEKSIQSNNDNVYEEIGSYIPKKRNGFFSRKKIFKTAYKDTPAQEEYIPLTNYTTKIKEIFA